MFALLSPRLWIALALAGALAFSHFTAYRAGKNNVKVEWLAATARANAEVERLNQRRQDRADESAALAASRARGLALDASRARGESVGLRDDLRAVQLHAAQSRAAADNAVGTLSAVVAECSATLVEVAGDADAARSEVKTLRDSWPK